MPPRQRSERCPQRVQVRIHRISTRSNKQKKVNIAVLFLNFNGTFLCSTYLLNASSREERQLWLAAVKKCQIAVSPKPSPKVERKQIVSDDKNNETKATEPIVTEKLSPSPKSDQATDSDSSSGDSTSMVVRLFCVQGIDLLL